MKTSVVNTLIEWERQNGQCWVQKIHSLAESGETWKSVADYFGVTVDSLKSACRHRGFKFPWQGHSSPLYREQRRKRLKEITRFRTYWYRGKPYLIRELAELSSIKETTIYCRINRKGWSVEDAVEKPVLSASAAGVLGARKREGYRAKARKQAQTDRVADATHGIRTQADMGRTQ